jgi:hypothetical protein
MLSNGQSYADATMVVSFRTSDRFLDKLIRGPSMITVGMGITSIFQIRRASCQFIDRRGVLLTPAREGFDDCGFDQIFT